MTYFSAPYRKVYRYQLAENIRMLELLRPLAQYHLHLSVSRYNAYVIFSFHGGSTCLSTIFFILFGPSMKDDIAYPIFEEAINMIQLQGIFMPIIFMRHEKSTIGNWFNIFYVVLERNERRACFNLRRTIAQAPISSLDTIPRLRGDGSIHDIVLICFQNRDKRYAVQ